MGNAPTSSSSSESVVLRRPHRGALRYHAGSAIDGCLSELPLDYSVVPADRAPREPVRLLAKIFRFKNQLDEKQYEQMSAPAFVCSSARLRAELAWAPEHNLADTLSNAAKGYRDTGWL